MALGILDDEYKPNMPEEKAREIAVKAIKSSIQRDSSSGDGIDLLSITKKGANEESLRL
jgi:proteasome beta subunit